MSASPGHGAASPNRPPVATSAIFKLKRAVVDPPGADAQTSLSRHRGLVFRLPFPADGPNGAGGRLSRSWSQRACAITRRASRRKAFASCRWRTSGAASALFEALRGFFRIVRIVRAERPDIVHCIALRMVAIGGLAARLGGAKRLVLAPTGLGLLWSEESAFNRFARAVLRFVVGRWLRGPDTHYLFENTDDPREFGLREFAAGDHRAGRGRRSGGISAFAGACPRRR